MSEKIPEGAIFMPENPLCKKHAEEIPQYLNRLAGFVMLQVTMFQACVGDERIMRRAGWKPASDGQPETPADSANLSVLINEVSPLCCFLGDDLFNLCVQWVEDCWAKGGPVDHSEWFRRLADFKSKGTARD